MRRIFFAWREWCVGMRLIFDSSFFSFYFDVELYRLPLISHPMCIELISNELNS